jgi:hypothetical protein
MICFVEPGKSWPAIRCGPQTHCNLAAALMWYEDQPARQPFVCLDQRLREAAVREGFIALPG